MVVTAPAVGDAGVGERVRKIGEAEIGIRELRTMQVRRRELAGWDAFGVAQLDRLQDGIRQLGAAQVGVVEQRAGQIRAPQVRLGQDGVQVAAQGAGSGPVPGHLAGAAGRLAAVRSAEGGRQ